MKLAFCSEFNDNEISWLHISQIPFSKSVQMQNRPTKAILGIILLLEQGKFPVIKINSVNDYPLKESVIVHEAYMRCHMSVVPTISIEEVGVANNADYLDLPPGQEEPDRDEPIGDPERE